MDELNNETVKLVKLESDAIINYEDEPLQTQQQQIPTTIAFQNSPPSSTTTLVNSLSPSSSFSLTNASKFNQTNANKLTLVPLNNSTSGSMLPIKRVIQVNTNTNTNVPSSTFLGTSPTRAINTTALNTNNLGEKTFINNKIFTSINTNNISNSNAITNANSSGNKIQVKIVNMASLNPSNNTNNNTIINSSPISNTTSNVNNSANNLASNISNPTSFKITTISASNNSGATNLQDGTNKSVTSILSTINARPIITKTSESLGSSSTTSALFEAINNTPTINTTTVKLATNHQIVNVNSPSSTNQPPRITTTTATTSTAGSTYHKAPVIQRIQSIQSTSINNQPITKTIVSASTSSVSNPNSSTTSTLNMPLTITQSNNNNNNNYKVLSQQLPSTTTIPTNSGALAVAQLNSLKSVNTNSKITNPIVITKTIAGNSNISNTFNDFSNDNNNSIRKQFITSVKNDSKIINRPIITTTTSQLSNNTSTITPINLTPIATNNSSQMSNSNGSHLPTSRTASITTNNNNNVQQNIDTNQKNFLQTNSQNLINNTRMVSGSSTVNQNTLNKSSENVPPNSFLNTSQQYNQISNANISQSQHQISNSFQVSLHNTQTSNLTSSLTSNIRKPCNCTKYCDCFAMGSFCHDCNCINCFNTLEHEDERNKAIKMVLDRNPQAFQSKIGKFTTQITQAKIVPPTSQATQITAIEDAVPVAITEEIDEIQSRHIKGCNCKKSNCLKRYCECYLAKIQCSTLCKCVGCKNCDESTKSLLDLANAADQRKQQQQQNFNQQTMNNSQLLLNGNSKNIFSLKQNSFGNKSSFIWDHNTRGFFATDLTTKPYNSLDMLNSYERSQLEKQQVLNNSYATLTDQAVEVTCARLIDRVAEELEHLSIVDSEEKTDSFSCDELMESLVIEEFGRCLADIIEKAENRKS